MARLSVTQVKSTIGTKPVHRKTMKALGLAGIGRSRTLPDSPDVRGMLARVTHLITVEPVADGGAPTASDGGSPPTVPDGGSPPTVPDGGSPPTASDAGAPQTVADGGSPPTASDAGAPSAPAASDGGAPPTGEVNA